MKKIDNIYHIRDNAGAHSKYKYLYVDQESDFFKNCSEVEELFSKDKKETPLEPNNQNFTDKDSDTMSFFINEIKKLQSKNIELKAQFEQTKSELEAQVEEKNQIETNLKQAIFKNKKYYEDFLRDFTIGEKNSLEVFNERKIRDKYIDF